jgi:electron transfer flavoprotein beta subunit
VEILVCVKRVPMVGGRIVLTADGQDVDTRMSGFTVSPHEECAVEEAVRIVEHTGGSVCVLTLGPAEAADQLRDMLALGAHHALLLETDGREWGPIATAAAIAESVRRRESSGEPAYDLLLFGNESADTGGYQVAVRVAHTLGLPWAAGIKSLELTEDGLVARREYRGGTEAYQLPRPAVISVKEGINLPRYPSLPGRLRAKRAEIGRFTPQWQAEGLVKQQLRVPAGERKQAEILGAGVAAVPELVRLLDELGVLS